MTGEGYSMGGGALLGRADVVLWGGGERRCGRKMRNLLRRCGT